VSHCDGEPSVMRFEVMCECGEGAVRQGSRGGAGQVTAVCVHVCHFCCAHCPCTHTGEAGLSMVFHRWRVRRWGGGAALLITSEW
jgi:hypothetical protein